MNKEIEKDLDRETKLSDMESELIQNIVTIRKNLHMTQQELADSAGVIRTTVARIENLMTSPQLNTLIKLLEPMGYTLKLEKIKHVKK
jgi:transcriptional regulator with XRE-family HTH domain